ncbi:MAG: hypothetical protein R2688_08700 [Fimbriimonadaceae bacterium]
MSYEQEPQIVDAWPAPGRHRWHTEKMSQSLGNYVSIIDEPNDMFGKTMSIPDSLIANWFELCTDVLMDEVGAMLAEGKNPRDAKIRLAKEIVALYHDQAAADAAEQYFIDTFSKRQQPVDAEEATIPDQFGGRWGSLACVLIAGLDLESNGKAKNLIKQGAGFGWRKGV